MPVLSHGLSRVSQCAARRLHLESLEQRHLLDASLPSLVAEPLVTAPWQNATRPLDVNNDIRVTPIDALLVINRLLNEGPGPLPPPSPGSPSAYYDTTGDNVLSALDALRVINRLNAPPVVSLSTIVPITADLTPVVVVSTTSPKPLVDGTEVTIDVDLNNDGDFKDPFESDYTKSQLWNGEATFPLTTALHTEPEGSVYQVKLRARLTDYDNIENVSDLQTLTVDTTTSSALADYVKAPDPTYGYQVIGALPFTGGTMHLLKVTSQTWRSTADVDQPVFEHYLRVYVPSGPLLTTAMWTMNYESDPQSPPLAVHPDIAQTAVALHSVVIQGYLTFPDPLSFPADTQPSRDRNGATPFTFGQYLDHLGAPGNETWPILVPAVKGMVRIMDTLQTFVPSVAPGQVLTDFVIHGEFISAWATWLTAAIDPRVRAIIPSSFEGVNLAYQLTRHYQEWGLISPNISAYETQGVFQRAQTPAFNELSKIIDPYRYFGNGRLTIPKLLLNFAGDDVTVADAAQFYVDDLPGVQNYLRYVPNQRFVLSFSVQYASILPFFATIAQDAPLPEFSWVVHPNGAIEVFVPNVPGQAPPTQVLLWRATNPDSRDTRSAYVQDQLWTSLPVPALSPGTYLADVPMPASGVTAYFIELTFPSSVPGYPFVFTTEIRVKSPLPLTPWPFGTGGVLPLSAPADDAHEAAVAFALALADEQLNTATEEAWAQLAPLAQTGLPVSLSSEEDALAAAWQEAASGPDSGQRDQATAADEWTIEAALADVLAWK